MMVEKARGIEKDGMQKVQDILACREGRGYAVVLSGMSKVRKRSVQLTG